MKRALKFDSMESAIFSYFFLNDILLGQVLVDDAIAVERIKLANTLNDFQQKEKNQLFAQFIAWLKEKEADISIDESRTLLRKLLNEFIG
jgi:3-methyladenine DNA glycosylase AlkC